jgi:diguanylate cyclase (GGDEF)-like protein
MPIALIDDDPVQRRVLRAILEHTGREVVEYVDGAVGWEGIRTDPTIQLVITDWMMPGLDGPSLIKKIRDAALPHYVYVLMLTARQDRTDIVAGLQSGADDYLTKPIDPREFVARVVVGERILQLEQELRSSRDEQRYLASHDLLTGALNRRAFYERLSNLFGIEELGPFSLLMLDIDHFKAVNDRFGHHIGDRALQRIVQSVRTYVRDTDWVARWGGEEFVVLLPATGHDQAVQIAERLRLAIARTPLVVSETVAVSLQVSIGITSARQISAADLDHLLREADEALYNAKESGRNRVWSATEGEIDLPEPELPAQNAAPPDTTEYLTAEQAIAEQAERRAAPFASDLSFEMLTQAATVERMSAGSETAQDDLRGLAQLNHELRGRFSGLIGMAELLLETELSDEQRDFMASILSSSTDLLERIDQIFARARSAAERSGDSEPVDLYTLIARELSRE